VLLHSDKNHWRDNKAFVKTNIHSSKMQKPPQIIVIPQSMLGGPLQKSLLKLAPSPITSSTHSMPRLVSKPSPLLSSSTSPMLSSNPRPVAAVVGNKRPAPVSTPSFLLDIKKEDEEEEDGSNGPVRKRANLDHLSPEERLMRRKLKNRVAAQTARDKKKAATDSMEKQLADLKVQLEESLATTAKLMESNNQLQLDNAALQKENLELQSRLGSLPSNLTLEVLPSSLPTTTLPSSLPSPNLPLSPPPSPSIPHSTLSNTVMSPPETSALTNVPQQQEQGDLTVSMTSSKTNLGLSSKDLTPWGMETAASLTVCCAAMMALAQSPRPHFPPSPSPSSSSTPSRPPLSSRPHLASPSIPHPPSISPPLPLKKRPTPG